MASIRTNAACLRTVTELKPRDFADCPEIGPSQPRALGVAIREFLADKEIGVALANLLNAVTDFLAAKPSARRYTGPRTLSPTVCSIAGYNDHKAVRLKRNQAPPI
jgi:hypothetical protein